MQESEARAYYLRDLRASRTAIDAFYLANHEFSSKKQVLKFLQDFRQAHENVTLYEYKKPIRHPWHFANTFFYIEPQKLQSEDIGTLLLIQKTSIDSKKILKNDLTDVRRADFIRNVFIHEHFFTRLIQRADLSGLRQALQLTAHSLAEVLIKINFDEQSFVDGQTLHLVFLDKVFIVSCETEKSLLIFKTVLLQRFMTTRQQQKYSEALKALHNSEKGFVMLLEDHQGCRLID